MLVTAGEAHSIFIDERTQTVYAFGGNAYGQLGLGDAIERDRPVRLESLSGVISVAAGNNHSLFLTEDGSVWSCGLNDFGQLGLGNMSNGDLPTLIKLPRIKAIAAGNLHSLFLDESGRVWNCGKDILGDSNILKPVVVNHQNLLNIVFMAAGTSSSIFIDHNGNVFSCGSNYWGELGLGHRSPVTFPCKIPFPPGIKIKSCSVGASHALFLDEDGNVWTSGYQPAVNLKGAQYATARAVVNPEKIQKMCNIVGVFAGCRSSFFIDSSYAIFAMGLNYNGQLGVGMYNTVVSPTRVENVFYVREVAVGNQHTIFLDEDSNFWASGKNDQGQLGLGDHEGRSVPQADTILAPVKSARKV